MALATDSDDRRVEIVLECTDLDANATFFAQVLGLRVERITPADSPTTIVMTGPHVAVRLERSDRDVSCRLEVHVADESAARTANAPNGTTLEFVLDVNGYELPDGAPSFSLVRSGDGFGLGRAGMEYRDLLPDRWGGRFIASHIRIPGGGPVADSVHFRRVRFQMIFCARGWVDLVYEDQGPPFRLHEGDSVLQPPGIRHRVLRASPGLEVIELGCPAVHDTFIDYEIELPTTAVDADREFGGQRFVRDVASSQPVGEPWRVPGLVARQTGIADATGGLAGATVIAADVPADADAPADWLTHGGEFLFDVVLRGAADLVLRDGPARSTRRVERVGPFDAIAIPPGLAWTWSAWSADFEFLELRLPDPHDFAPSSNSAR